MTISSSSCGLTRGAGKILVPLRISLFNKSGNSCTLAILNLARSQSALALDSARLNRTPTCCPVQPHYYLLTIDELSHLIRCDRFRTLHCHLRTVALNRRARRARQIVATESLPATGSSALPVKSAWLASSGCWTYAP